MSTYKGYHDLVLEGIKDHLKFYVQIEKYTVLTTVLLAVFVIFSWFIDSLRACPIIFVIIPFLQTILLMIILGTTYKIRKLKEKIYQKSIDENFVLTHIVINTNSEDEEPREEV